MLRIRALGLVRTGVSAMRTLHSRAFPARVPPRMALSSLQGHLRFLSTTAVPQTEIDMNKVLVQWPGVYRVPLSHVIMSCLEDPALVDAAKREFIEPRLWREFVPLYRRAAVKDPLDAFGGMQNLRAIIDACGDAQEIAADDNLDELRKLVVPLMLQYAVKMYPNEIKSFQALCSTSDLRLPHEWFPYARLMKRKIYYHGGPTNSGKTYRALQRLKEAKAEFGGGLYCGPLRLLALEVYEQLNASGVYCDLVTGQEKRHMPFSTHVSCTVEMINFNKDYDVAVVDEIQMIGNEQRGHCWTRALQGLRAREIHLCGGSEAAQVVESLCKDMGDDYEFVEYKRLSPLHVADESLQGDYSKVQPGDCIVAFSRADIFSIKREIEATTKHKCCVVYGQLPSETRSQQAKLFNTEGSGYDVLVASDAIGMGLNLNIRRVIFHTTLKLDKGHPQYVEPAFVKQIAGRAGRASSKHKEGIATAWQDVDLAYIRSVMEEETPQVKQAGLFPIMEQVEYFAQQLAQMSTDQTTRLSSLLGKFVELAQIDGRYAISEHTDLLAISNFLQPVPLTLAQRFTFANAPVNTRDSFMMQRLYQFATCVALDKAVSMNLRLPARSPTNVADLSALCAKHNELDLYLWLALRFPRNFVEKDICQAQKRHAISLIDAALHNPKLRQPTSHINAYKHLRNTFNDQHGSHLHPNLVYAKKMRQFLGDNVGLAYPPEEPSDSLDDGLRRSSRRSDRPRSANGRRSSNGDQRGEQRGEQRRERSNGNRDSSRASNRSNRDNDANGRSSSQRSKRSTQEASA